MYFWYFILDELRLGFIEPQTMDKNRLEVAIMEWDGKTEVVKALGMRFRELLSAPGVFADSSLRLSGRWDENSNKIYLCRQKGSLEWEELFVQILWDVEAGDKLFLLKSYKTFNTLFKHLRQYYFFLRLINSLFYFKMIIVLKFTGANVVDFELDLCIRKNNGSSMSHETASYHKNVFKEINLQT